MSDGKNLVLYACASGHVYFFRHDRCQECQRDLVEHSHEPHAVLVTQTTVRVSPTGSEFRLGIAEVDSRVRTLCIVEKDVTRREPVGVVLDYRDGIYYAKKAD